MTRIFDTSDGAGERAALRQAADWLAKLELGTADQRAFEAWRSGDVARAVAFARIVGISEATARDPSDETIPERASRRGFLRVGAASGTVLALGIGCVSERAYAWNSASSAVGQSRMVRLPDGSAAKLNTDSNLAWRFTESGRTLWIENGEVALDLRPGAVCLLHGPTEQVTLAAGRYNARLRGETLDLLVMRGRAVAGDTASVRSASPVVAKAGQGMLVPTSAPVVRSATADEMAATLAWQQGEILFQHETLGSAVDEYNRYLHQKIVIVDRDLANVPIAGRFTSSDPSAFLTGLQLGLGIRVSTSQSGFLLTR